MRRPLPILAGFMILALLVLSTSTPIVAGMEFGDQLVTKLEKLLKSDLVSPQTKDCIECHVKHTPDIVYEWLLSKHAQKKPADVAKLYEKIGAPEWAEKIAEKFKNYKYVVGCYECHGMFKDKDRPDIIENHNGYTIVTIVTRKDCGQCHPKEDAEFSWSWHATAAFAPIKPWYSKILAWAKSKGANPFGDEKAKKLYEKYFPPYLLRERDKEPVYWDSYKEIAKAVMEYVETGKENEIVKMLKEATGMVTPYDWDWKKWISPLWPASGVLNTTVLAKLGIKLPVTSMQGVTKEISNVMSHPSFRNGYIYHACFECHGSIVIPYKKETVELRGRKVNRVALWGWPNNGAGRIDPDGSIGTCTACHPRHLLSVRQARDPKVCGQCHLGYDHPHIEIYEESKHGNIWHTYGKYWNWDNIPWRVGVDFNAPTCALCHMSTIATPDGKIVVPGTHDLVKRLVWDQMHFFTHPKPVIPDNIQTGMFLGYSMLKGKMEDVYTAYEKTKKWPVFMGLKIVDDGGKPGETKFPRLLKVVYTGELEKHREEMKTICKLCHSTQWVENYFRTADQNLIDYDIVARFAFSLLQLAWEEGIHDKKNLADEYMEIMWYYIWHHDGRRWRNGATMMGPDFAHWFGIVDTVMDKLGRMITYLDTALKIKLVEAQLKALKQQAAGAPYMPELSAKISKLEKELQELRSKLSALEAQVPALKSKLVELETGYTGLESEAKTLKTDVKTLVKQLEDLSKQLETITPQAKKLSELVAEIKDVVYKLEKLGKEVKEASSKAEEAGAKASEASMRIKDVSSRIQELSGRISSISAAAYTLGGLALAVAVVALALALVRTRRPA